MTCATFSIKFAKTIQKFAENSEFCEKKFTIIVNYSLHSSMFTVVLHTVVQRTTVNMDLARQREATVNMHLALGADDRRKMLN